MLCPPELRGLKPRKNVRRDNLAETLAKVSATIRNLLQQYPICGKINPRKMAPPTGFEPVLLG